MPRATDRRRTQFLAALAAVGQSQSAWAAANGITKGHLSQVLHGKRESVTLTQKIDAFVAEHAGGQTVAA